MHHQYSQEHLSAVFMTDHITATTSLSRGTWRILPTVSVVSKIKKKRVPTESEERKRIAEKKKKKKPIRKSELVDRKKGKSKNKLPLPITR